MPASSGSGSAAPPSRLDLFSLQVFSCPPREWWLRAPRRRVYACSGRCGCCAGSARCPRKQRRIRQGAEGAAAVEDAASLPVGVKEAQGVNRPAATHPATSAYVSIRQHTSAVKEARRVNRPAASHAATNLLTWQYLYFCTSKASKVSTWRLGTRASRAETQQPPPSSLRPLEKLYTPASRRQAQPQVSRPQVQVSHPQVWLHPRR
jgi:hypothetical protein